MGSSDTTTVTAAAAKTAIATSCNVQESAITVTTAATGGRRLNARRLADVSFDAVIVTDATNAATVKTAAATVTPPAGATVTVTTAPAVEVTATVQVESITPIAEAQVSTTVLNEIAVAAAGSGATATVKSGSWNSERAYTQSECDGSICGSSGTGP